MYSMINSFPMVILDVDWDTHNVSANLIRIILTDTFCSFFRLLLPQIVIHLLFLVKTKHTIFFQEKTNVI